MSRAKQARTQGYSSTRSKTGSRSCLRRAACYSRMRAASATGINVGRLASRYWSASRCAQKTTGAASPAGYFLGARGAQTAAVRAMRVAVCVCIALCAGAGAGGELTVRYELRSQAPNHAAMRCEHPCAVKTKLCVPWNHLDGPLESGKRRVTL